MSRELIFFYALKLLRRARRKLTNTTLDVETGSHTLSFSAWVWLLGYIRHLTLFRKVHSKMKRANLAPKMGPKRVIYPHWNGAVLVQIWGAKLTLTSGPIRPWEGLIWKTLAPLWIFKWPKQLPQISALLQTTPQKVADSVPRTSGHFSSLWVFFVPLLISEIKRNLKLSNIFSVLNKLLYTFFAKNNEVSINYAS